MSGPDEPWVLWHERVLREMPTQTAGARTLVCPVCPDLLDYEALGVADNWRGRVVRAFFWLMRAWP